MITSLRGVKFSLARNKTLLKKIFIFYTIWWIAIFCLGTYSLARIHAPVKIVPSSTYSGPEWSKTFINFDGSWYYEIATQGYPKKLDSRDVFYPLFPSVVAVVSRLGISLPVAALSINYLAGFIASVFFVLLFRDFAGRGEGSEQSLPFLLFFPTAFVLLAFYTEALFLALMLSSFYFARRGTWWIACLLAGLLTAVRLPGIAVAIAIFVEYWSQRYYQWSKIDNSIGWFLLAPLGLAAYMLYLYSHTGDALAMIHAYSLGEWPFMRQNFNIPGTVYDQFSTLLNIAVVRGSGWIESFANIALPFFFWLGGLVVTILGRKKLRISYLVFMAISLFFFSINSNFISSNRYAITYFPVLFLIAAYFMKRPLYYGLTVGLSASLMAVWMLMFVNGYFVI
jgi:hypothetical protein